MTTNEGANLKVRS